MGRSLDYWVLSEFKNWIGVVFRRTRNNILRDESSNPLINLYLELIVLRFARASCANNHQDDRNSNSRPTQIRSFARFSYPA